MVHGFFYLRNSLRRRNGSLDRFGSLQPHRRAKRSKKTDSDRPRCAKLTPEGIQAVIAPLILKHHLTKCDFGSFKNEIAVKELMKVVSNEKQITEIRFGSCYADKTAKGANTGFDETRLNVLTEEVHQIVKKGRTFAVSFEDEAQKKRFDQILSEKMVTIEPKSEKKALPAVPQNSKKSPAVQVKTASKPGGESGFAAGDLMGTFVAELVAAYPDHEDGDHAVEDGVAKTAGAIEGEEEDAFVAKSEDEGGGDDEDAEKEVASPFFSDAEAVGDEIEEAEGLPKKEDVGEKGEEFGDLGDKEAFDIDRGGTVWRVFPVEEQL